MLGRFEDNQTEVKTTNSWEAPKLFGQGPSVASSHPAWNRLRLLRRWITIAGVSYRLWRSLRVASLGSDTVDRLRTRCTLDTPPHRVNPFLCWITSPCRRNSRPRNEKLLSVPTGASKNSEQPCSHRSGTSPRLDWAGTAWRIERVVPFETTPHGSVHPVGSDSAFAVASQTTASKPRSELRPTVPLWHSTSTGRRTRRDGRGSRGNDKRHRA
jgi:hypothetical protein